MRETPRAAAAYEEYAAMGPSRSLRKLADKSGTKLAQLGEWSSEHQWQERVKSYDAERIEEKRRKQEAAIDAMNERHAMIGTTQQARAIKQIEALIEAKSFGSMAAVQLLKLATDLERVARGASTEQISVTGKNGEALSVSPNVIVYLPDNGRDRVEGEGL